MANADRNKRRLRYEGFTLIELSIVLVIIGLLVGGVLVGRDLISSAEVRAQISQIEKYRLAMNTFRLKYGYLPGDIPAPHATGFGFVSRGIYDGTGDGDGKLEGIFSYAANQTHPAYICSGENGLVWRDLSYSALISNNFNTATYNVTGGGATATLIARYLPYASINQAAFIYTYNDGASNWFGLTNTTFIVGTLANYTPSLTVQQAFSIDSKIGDGNPGVGSIIASYFYDDGFVTGGTGKVWVDGNTSANISTSAVSGSSTTCYDNGNVNGATQKYSVGISSGTGINCALSFKFQ